MRNLTKIHLGGTARSPDDVVLLNELGLQFAEIPITNPEKFLSHIESYQDLREDLGLYYLCHGPREGDPNNADTLENTYLPKLMHILSIMPQMEMRLLTIHLSALRTALYALCPGQYKFYWFPRTSCGK